MIRHIAVFSGVLAALSAALLFGLFQFRANVYAETEVVLSSMADLYAPTADAVAITGFHQKRPGEVTLEIANLSGCTAWQIAGGNADASTTADRPTIELQPGTRDYYLTPTDCRIMEPARDAIEINISYGALDTPSARIQELSKEVVQINRVNVPLRADAPMPLERWVPDVFRHYPEEARAARAWLRAQGFDDTAPVLDRIVFLASIVRANMPSGTPPAFLNSIHPFQVLREGMENGVGCFCRQWALVYTYLANVAGLPSRMIFTGGADPVVDLGSHALAETYIADEARWAYVDPTNDIAYVTNEAGSIVNAAEIYLASTADMTGALTARSIDAELADFVPFPVVERPVRHFMHRSNYLIYFGALDGRYQLDPAGWRYYAAKIERFLFQPQRYFGHVAFQSYHWVRAAAFFAAIGSGLVFAVSAVVMIGRRIGKQRKS